ETAELVIAAVGHGQREFEAFLQRLDERLGSLQGHFSEQAEAQEDRRSASATLESSVRLELVTIGSHMSEASDLDALRESVGQHLDTIGQRLDGFRQQEQEREAVLSGQLRAMQEKLAAMETHCEQIREKLQEERQRALTDILTDLPNREAWDDRLVFEYDRWRRYGHPITLCVLDIDHFKQVNDSYGHKAGDKVLQLVARALRERLRTTDFVARYGGEEFVVLLPETRMDVARTVIDDLRLHIGQLPFHFQGQPVNVTFSAGLSWFREGAGPDVVFDEADKALYQAKQNGRNRIEMTNQQGTE
uniref:GGDEF domain-containing protein n=1 Tax=uncultured Marinobacter sp. TaxID=187379 RepID=UPI0030D954D9